MSQAPNNSYLSEHIKHGNILAKTCPSRRILHDVTSRWGVLILVVLLDGTHRFSALRKKIIGVSEKMLAQNLQALEADGFVERISYPVVPPHVEYNLTPNGIIIAQQVKELTNWIEMHLSDILQSQTQYYEQKDNLY